MRTRGPGSASSAAGPSLVRDDVARLREGFLGVDYTADGVLELLGPTAQAALSRAETVPARRRTADGSPLATLVRLFLLQLPVPASAARAAVPAYDACVAGGVLAADGDEVRAAVDIRPYGADDGPWWVVSDLGTGLDGLHRPLRDDHVLGVGGASTTLAQLTVRPPVQRALDIGTGCGVQALHLARHAGTVVGTDVLPRALAMAELTAGLSGVEVDLREGSLLDPVAGETYDLIVSNPPFVVKPPDTGGYTYRDSGLAWDEVCRRLVTGLPAHLAPGGWAQLLANWVHRRGQDWESRVGAWLAEAGCDAWVVQREVQDPAEYVATWLRDSGEAGGEGYVAAYDAWLGALEDAGIEAVGFGWVALRRSDAAPVVRVEDWPHAVEQPMGPHVQGWAQRTGWLRSADDEALLGARLRVADDVVQEQLGAPGAEDPEHVLLRQHRGMRRAERVGTVLGGVVGACDGTLALGAIIDAVAAILDEDVSVVRRDTLTDVRRLVADGFLLPRS
jgi:methylase of polypeptide subunit release factors